MPLSPVSIVDRIGKEARDVRKEDQPDKLRMISLTDSAPQQLQKVHYSTRTTQNSQFPLSPVSIVDRIGKEARDVRREDQPDKLRMISLTDSAPQQIQKVHYSTRTIVPRPRLPRKGWPGSTLRSCDFRVKTFPTVLWSVTV